MNYEVEAIPNFRKDLKKLAKKYTSIKEDFGNLLQSLEQNPVQGTFLGNNCYKIRMQSPQREKANQVVQG